MYSIVVWEETCCIMHKYVCITCGFRTNNLAHLRRHNKTKRHLHQGSTDKTESQLMNRKEHKPYFITQATHLREKIQHLECYYEEKIKKLEISYQLELQNLLGNTLKENK